MLNCEAKHFARGRLWRDGGYVLFVPVGGAPLVAASMNKCWPKHVVISLMQETILSVAVCGLCFATVVCVCGGGCAHVF
jgi:hypothetical protein